MSPTLKIGGNEREHQITLSNQEVGKFTIVEIGLNERENQLHLDSKGVTESHAMVVHCCWSRIRQHTAIVMPTKCTLASEAFCSDGQSMMC